MAIGDELASLDFEAMIGGPLTAVVKAQTQAAMTSVDFIKAVGFDVEEENKPVMVTFSYDKAVEQTAPDGTVTVEVKPFNLTVPILTMLPIPFIRVEETTIDFHAKINSVQESTATTETGLATELKAKAGWLFGSVKLKVNYSQKKSTSATQKVERTYTLAVHVRAVQDELPAGTDRLLGILENTITEVPGAA
jgi:hypothetical protein